jgi:DNA end-binding protein Ku
MEEMSRAGIATFVMRGKEHLVAIFAENSILLAQTLRFADEIRSPEDVGLPEVAAPSKQLVSRFAKIIDKHSARDLPRKELQDQRIAQLLKLVEKKRKRNEDVVQAPEAETRRAEVLDILTLLKRTLAKTQEESKPQRRPPAPERSTTKQRRRAS